jgi:hypothetical protein
MMEASSEDNCEDFKNCNWKVPPKNLRTKNFKCVGVSLIIEILSPYN